jgi:hypothetical protein
LSVLERYNVGRYTLGGRDFSPIFRHAVLLEPNLRVVSSGH